MPNRSRVLVVLGTRPEAIKLAPVISAMKASRTLEPILAVTGQHRSLLDPVLALFGLSSDLDFDLMRPRQTPAAIVADGLSALAPVVARVGAKAVVVQGDTASTLAGALAGFYAGVPVAHVEAGLRSDDAGAPFPEEGHRRMVAQIARLHFAPTPAARDALLDEGIAPERIHVTGNSGIDALISIDRRFARHPDAAAQVARAFPYLTAGRSVVAVTAHRRENHGERLKSICAGLRMIARREEADIVFPVHPNPAVRETVEGELGGVANIHLSRPLDYVEFIWLMRRASLIMTDSGGVQEEAPALGRPLLILRDGTERPEGVAAGTAALVGADPAAIAGAARAVLRDPAVAAWMGRPLELYGKGDAGATIARILARHLAPPRAAPRRTAVARDQREHAA